MVTPTQREKRIGELRDYARDNFNAMVERADKDIQSLGWIRNYDSDFHPHNYDRPAIQRRDMFYPRPWGDFFLTLVDYSQEHFYVTDTTAKSYARVALKPFEKDLFENWKYKEGRGSDRTLSRRRD